MQESLQMATILTTYALTSLPRKDVPSAQPKDSIATAPIRSLPMPLLYKPLQPQSSGTNTYTYNISAGNWLQFSNRLSVHINRLINITSVNVHRYVRMYVHISMYVYRRYIYYDSKHNECTPTCTYSTPY